MDDIHGRLLKLASENGELKEKLLKDKIIRLKELQIETLRLKAELNSICNHYQIGTDRWWNED